MKSDYRLLIVDDELSNLQKLQRTFFGEFNLFQAQTGDEALKLLHHEPFDVIITDQKMPGISGVELLSHSLELSPESIRIILTGYTEVDYLMDAINRGQVHRYITKPWEPFVLKQIVRQDLEHLELKRSNHFYREQLRIAREVQRHLYPQRLPKLSTFEYSGICQPADQVGGDYYDILVLDDDRFCFAVGDVSGKGVSAALLMASMQALLRCQMARTDISLPTKVAQMSELLGEMTEGNRFSTLFCGVFQREKNLLTYVNAGHSPPLLVGSAGDVRLLEPTGVPIGLFEEARYGEGRETFVPGETLVIFTDGIIEASNDEGEEFGDERFRQSVREHRHLPAAQLQQALLDEVVGFVGEGHLQDDLTLLVLSHLKS